MDMEAVRPERAAAWECSCAQPSLHFCTTCLPVHVQSPGQHHLTPLGLMGAQRCSLCQSSGSIIHRRLPEEPLPPEIFRRPAVDIPPSEALAQQGAERPRIEIEDRLRADQHAGSLQAVFLQRKNDFRLSIMQAMENMNGLEDAFYRALGHDAELRVCQTQLAYAQEEIIRLRALPQPQVQAVPANEALVEGLKTQLEQLNVRLLDQAELLSKIEDLSTQVAQLKFELQQSIQDQVEEQLRENNKDLRRRLQEVTQIAINKVSSVMPLMTHLDEDWLDREGAESFLELASLGINDDLQSTSFPQVARVCAMLARASGPCRYLATFANEVNTRLKRNSEAALQLVNQLEGVYLKLKEQPTAKASFQRLLRLAESEALDDTVTILLRFDSTELTLYGDAIMDFIAEDRPTRDEWRLALLSLPIKWTKDFPEDMNKILLGVIKRDFDLYSLRLLQLLQIYQPADAARLLSFVIRTSHLLTNQQLIPSIDALLHEVTELVSLAIKLPPTDSKQACDRIFIALRLVTTSSTSTQLDKTAQLLSLLKPGQVLLKAACVLVYSFAEFKDETNMSKLCFGALNWLLPSGKPRVDTTVAEWLLLFVHDSEDTADQAGQLLTELGKSDASSQLEQIFPSILSKLPLEKPLKLRFAYELLVALNVGNEVELMHLLQELEKVLNIDNLPLDVVLRVPRLWLKGRQRLPNDARMTKFCIHVLKQPTQEELPSLLEEAERVFEQDDVSYETALMLTHLYTKHTPSKNALRKWLMCLRNLPKSDALAALFHQVDSLQQVTPRVVVDFVDAVLLMCSANTTEIGELIPTLGTLVEKEEALQLLTSITALSDLELKIKLLHTARLQQDKPTLVSCIELCNLLTSFELKSIPLPDLRSVLLHRFEDLTRLGKACVHSIPQMPILSSKLLTELGSRPNAEVLLFITTVAAQLQATVITEKVEELGEELIEASKDAVGEKRIRKLQGSHMTRLTELLKREVKVWLALEEVLSQPTELVHVTNSFFRFFNVQTTTWGPQITLKGTILADQYFSNWLILEDESVFCCGGDCYAGYKACRLIYGQSTSHSATESWKETYIIQRDGSWEPKGSMNVGRSVNVLRVNIR